MLSDLSKVTQKVNAELEIESRSYDFQCVSSGYVLPPEISMLMKLPYGVYNCHSTPSLELA